MESPSVQLLGVHEDRLILTRGGNLYYGDTPTGVTRVFGCDVAPSTHLLAAITLNKEVLILDTSSAPPREIARHAFPKRLTGVKFTRAGDEVLISDAFGDVVQLPTQKSVNVRDEIDQDRYRILGHFSTITDFALTDRRIVTADRDGKVRVSRFPHSYVIESFCLGHTDFVTCLAWTRTADRLLSGSGDGTIRLWNAANGEELSGCHLDEWKIVKETVVDTEDLVVGKLVLHPTDDDKVFVLLTRSTSVFEMSGLRKGALRDVAIVKRLEAGQVVTGFDVKGGSGWLSATGKCEVHTVDLDDYARASVVETEWPYRMAEENRMEDEDEDMLRLQWLAKQRKKEMVEDWKGKKRRRIEK